VIRLWSSFALLTSCGGGSFFCGLCNQPQQKTMAQMLYLYHKFFEFSTLTGEFFFFKLQIPLDTLVKP